MRVKVSSRRGLRPFARIGEDGTVYVKDGDEERVVGGFPEGIPASPYAL